MDDSSRYARGLAKLKEIDDEAGLAVLDSLADVAPALGTYVVEFAFGDTYSRPGLAPRDRQFITVGVLTALGGCEPQLRVHINAALNVGLTPNQVIEAIIHTVPYVGFPRALNATFVAREEFHQHGLLPVSTTTPA